jgi:hypothetical protein
MHESTREKIIEEINSAFDDVDDFGGTDDLAENLLDTILEIMSED